MVKKNNYGFKADLRYIKKLGKILKEFRENNNATFADISRKTLIDISTLYRLEQGEIPRVNFFMLKKIADYYNINVLELFMLTGVINKDDIINYMTFTKHDDSNIPIFSSLVNFENSIIDFYINAPFSYIDSMKGFIFNNIVYIFNSSYDSIYEKYLFIISFEKNIILSKILFFEGNIFLNDVFTGNSYVSSKKNITILGKVLYELKILK